MAAAKCSKCNYIWLPKTSNSFDLIRVIGMGKSKCVYCLMYYYDNPDDVWKEIVFRENAKLVADAKDAGICSRHGLVILAQFGFRGQDRRPRFVNDKFLLEYTDVIIDACQSLELSESDKGMIAKYFDDYNPGGPHAADWGALQDKVFGGGAATKSAVRFTDTKAAKRK